MSATPVPKVAAAGVGGAAASVLIWVASQFGLDLPLPVAMAMVTVASFAAGYLKKDRRSLVEKLKEDAGLTELGIIAVSVLVAVAAIILVLFLVKGV